MAKKTSKKKSSKKSSKRPAKKPAKAKAKATFGSNVVVNGQSYFFRTVTHAIVGKVKSVAKGFAIVEDAWWVADTGDFGECIKNGTIDKGCAIGYDAVNLSSCVDILPWKHGEPKVKSQSSALPR